MPRSHEVQSGPEDNSEAVDYSEGEIVSRSADDGNDSDYDSDRDTRRQQRKQPASSSSHQENHIRQSASNAREAASSAASNSASAENRGESNDLRLITLVKRYERKLSEIGKRERDLAEREKASSHSSKRSKSSSSHRRSSESSYSSDSDSSSDGDNHGHGGGRSSSSKESDGKDITLRQLAIMNKIVNLKYVDISTFSRANLNVRKAKKLVPISSSAEFSAAWASFNVELQQYLINANRSDDALMVSKYYSQLVRLLADYSSQWKLVMELDEYIRGATFTVNDRIVWNIDHDDDYVSRFRYDIRMKHLDAASRLSGSSHRDAPASHQRRGGTSDSSVIKPRRSTGVCYAYNGESTPNVWTNVNHCRGKDKCKFQHKCMICAGDHAVYENKDCAAQTRARTPLPRHK
jgi:hypothetical protein